MKTVWKNLVGFFFVLLIQSQLQATIINIPADQPSIQGGIGTAVNGDTVLVQPGNYLENINFNGKLITVGSLFLTTGDTAYISTTIIDGNGGSDRVVRLESGENSSALLSGFTITNGRGISCDNSSPILQDLVISGNSSDAWQGGAVSIINASPILQNLTITGNATLTVGGGIYCHNYSNPSLQDVRISGNFASANGGGIYCGGYCNPILQNVDITDNSSHGVGGGMYCGSSSEPVLQNVTMSGNSGLNGGGGLYCDSGDVVLINSILWGDVQEEIAVSDGGTVIVTWSDIEGGWAGTGNIDTDPLFVYPGIGDYHLQPGSPCIDAGDPASPLDPDGTITEMGAYYYLHPPTADFSADPTSGPFPLTVAFSDLSTEGSGAIDQWQWDFGDGQYSDLQNPTHEYQVVGKYTVTLTVIDLNDNTDSETRVDYIWVTAPPYNGPVWHISTTGSDDLGNGTEQYPFATIQHGIDSAADTDTVLVQPGTYLENINYNGNLITVASLYLTTGDPVYISSTIIDGSGSGSIVTFANGEDSTTVFSGFTVTNGAGGYGGGISCNNAGPYLEHLIISGNSASHAGGVYFASSRTLLSEM